MKKIIIGFMVSFFLITPTARGQVGETSQLLINWEKLEQLRQILDNMYWGYKVMDKGYTTIRLIAEGNYKLHEAFMDALMLVNPAVRNYKRIPMIISYQKLLLKEYKRAYNRFRKDPGFKLDELEYLANVYTFLIDASLRNIDELTTIVTATRLRMTDEERMAAIDRIFWDMENKVIFLRSFNNTTQLLAIQRARSRTDINTLQSLYGIN